MVVLAEFLRDAISVFDVDVAAFSIREIMILVIFKSLLSHQ